MEQQFPEYEIEEIDVVSDLLRRQPSIVLSNLFWVVRRYWRRLLTGRHTIRYCYYRTPYIFHKIRDLVRARLEPRKHEFAFSLQTQSLYDASIPGLPHFVYTDHTHLTNLVYPGFPKEDLFARAWIDLEQEIYRNASHVFVMSEHVRQTLIDFYGCNGADSSCIYAGSNIDPSSVPVNNDDYRNETIVFVGLEWERKGGKMLLEAFEKVAQKREKARLVIIGSAPRISHPRIEVLGRLSHAQVKERLSQASIFCLPTRVEPFGIAVVEAFFHKLPVITTSIGAMPNLVRHGESGLLVPPDDARQLEAALLDLLENPEKCRRFGERGHSTVTARYSWEEVGRKLRMQIDSALSSQLAAA